MNKNVVRAARIIVASMFIFSGLAKVVSLNFFDTEILAKLFLGKEKLFDHPTGMFWIQVLSRLIVSGEIVLGIAILQEKWFKKVVLPATMLLLIAFTVQLIFDGIQQDNFVTGNCGCFGKVLPMTILESILKNVASMGITLFIWVYYKKGKHGFKSWVTPVLVGLVTFGTLLFTMQSYERRKPVQRKVTPIPEPTWQDNTQVQYDQLLKEYKFQEAYDVMKEAIGKDSTIIDPAEMKRLEEVLELKKEAADPME